MLKKIIVAAVTVLALSGCGSAEETEPKCDSSTMQCGSPSAGTDEQNYIEEMQSQSETFRDADEQALISAARDTCEYFYKFGANADSVSTLMLTLSEEFGVDEASIAVAAAVNNFCPEFVEPINDVVSGGASA